MKNLNQMLVLQDRMNTRVHPEWRAQGFAWLRAAAIEAGEALESLGWKWWKKQDPDMANVRVELVDIWHFLLSAALSDYDTAEKAEDFLNSKVCHATMVPTVHAFSPFHPQYDLVAITPQDRMDLLIGLCALRAPLNQIVSVFHAIRILDVGMTDDELYVGYLSKNVLNFFRQDHGYKAGTYHKNWSLDGGQEEDNVVMTRLATELLAGNDLTESTLYNALAAHYVQVCAANTKAEQNVDEDNEVSERDEEYARRLKGEASVEDDASPDNSYSLKA